MLEPLYTFLYYQVKSELFTPKSEIPISYFAISGLNIVDGESEGLKALSPAKRRDKSQ
ncbi:MAG: hypothetical protein QME51_03440 [Planctomycetota bacterium]|nr:hypothetical protein [Planctomycetota bacterium]MDI6787403.1 hypothetical protein [Planctomycetota bacterium]